MAIATPVFSIRRPQPYLGVDRFDGPTLLGDLSTTTPGTETAIIQALPGRKLEAHDDIGPNLVT